MSGRMRKRVGMDREAKQLGLNLLKGQHPPQKDNSLRQKRKARLTKRIKKEDQ